MAKDNKIQKCVLCYEALDDKEERHYCLFPVKGEAHKQCAANRQSVAPIKQEDLDKLDRLEKEAAHAESCNIAGCKRCYVDENGETISEDDLETLRYDVRDIFTEILQAHSRALIDMAQRYEHAKDDARVELQAEGWPTEVMIANKQYRVENKKLWELLERFEWLPDDRSLARSCWICGAKEDDGHKVSCVIRKLRNKEKS